MTRHLDHSVPVSPVNLGKAEHPSLYWAQGKQASPEEVQRRSLQACLKVGRSGHKATSTGHLCHVLEAQPVAVSGDEIALAAAGALRQNEGSLASIYF